MGQTEKETPCNKCAYFIHSKEKGMVCVKNLEYSKECYTTEHEKYLQESESIPANNKFTLIVDGKRTTALLKEVRYIVYNHKWQINDECIEKTSYRNFRYNIEIDGEELLYSFVSDMYGDKFLQANISNDIYSGKVRVKITNYINLIKLLWEASNHLDDIIGEYVEFLSRRIEYELE